MLKIKGYSLIGTIFTLLISSTVITSALPHLSSLLEKNRQTQAINQMTGALLYARSTAVLRRTTITLCPGQEHCLATPAWSDQILIFIDHNQDGQLGSDDEIINHIKLPNGYIWRWANFRNKTYSQFAENGRTRALNGTFSLCHNNVITQQVVINVTGRVRTQKPPAPAQCH
jgi:type IV fimbrial biogenesis protein FimT